jgi:hypothetical protein
MFRALLAHPREALYKRHLIYCVRFMSPAPGLEWNCEVTKCWLNPSTTDQSGQAVIHTHLQYRLLE